MLHERRIGAARVGNVTEMIAPTHDPARVFADLPRPAFDAAMAVLGPAQYCARLDRLVIGIQLWLLDLGDAMVVIDTGVGNGKPRGLPRFDRLNTQTPLWLAAFGATPERVTHVVNTHLHGDHVGGNTIAGPAGWQPAFPRAEYWFPARDLAYFRALHAETGGVGETEAMTDGVLPLLESGRWRSYGDGDAILPGLVARDARGHTPGQMALWLDSDGASGVFCADIFHSPLQILHPQLNTPFCIEPDQARATRARFLQQVADSGTLIMPCHFGAPHCGYVGRDGAGYRFVPERR